MISRPYKAFNSRSVIDYYRRGEDPKAPPVPGSEEEGEVIEETTPSDIFSQTINIGGQEIPIIYLVGGGIALIAILMVMKK